MENSKWTWKQLGEFCRYKESTVESHLLSEKINDLYQLAVIISHEKLSYFPAKSC